MVGIIGAMPVEIELINEKILKKEVIVINNITFTKGIIGSRGVVTAVCGMGKVNAAICAQIMIFEFNPDCIINTGVAGAISDELMPCDVAVASSLYQHDLDITPLGYPLGFISGADITKIPADDKISNDILECCKRVIDNKVIMGTIVSGDQFINQKEKKQFLRDTFNAVACEMEGAAIAHVCYVNDVKFAVVRAISDSANGEANMDFNEFVKKACVNSSKILFEYLK